MATAGMGVDLRLNASGNAEQKLQALNRQLNQSVKAVDDLGRSQSRATSIALKQAASLGLLGHELGRLSTTFLNMSKTGLGFFGQMLESGAELQRAKQGLSIFFGSNSDTLAGAILNISSETEIAAPKLIDLARKLGSLGLNQDQTVKGTRALASALSTLPAERQTRVLNSLGTTLNTANGLQRVFALELTKAQKAQIQNLDGHARTIKILDILAAKYGDASKILSGGLAFQWKQLHNLVEKNILAKIALPTVEALSGSFGKLVLQLVKFSETAGFQERVIKPLSDAFLGLARPVIKLIDYLTAHNTIPKVLEWLGDHAHLVEMAAMTTIIGTGLTGAFLSLASAIFIASASMLLWKRVTLPQLKGMFGGPGKAIPGAGQAIAQESFTTAKGAGGFLARMIKGPSKDLAGDLGIAELAGKINFVLTPFRMLNTVIASVGSSMLALVGFLMTGASLAGVFIGMFDVGKAPALAFFKTMVGGIKDAIDGMMQVLQTGSISEELFVKLNNSGFGPMWRVLTVIGMRLKEIFQVGMELGSTMGPDIQQAFDIVKFAFLDIFNVVLRVMETLGILDKNAGASGRGMGVIFGTVVVGALKLVLWIIEAVVLAIDTVVRRVGGAIEMMSSLVHFTLAASAGLMSLRHGGALTAEGKAWDDIAKSEGKDAKESIVRGFGTMWGGAGQTSSAVAPGAPAPGAYTVRGGKVYLNGREVGEVLGQQVHEESQAGGEW